MDYWITQPRVIFHYLLLSFWPYPLCIDYVWPVSTMADAWPFMMLLALFLIVSIYALFTISSDRILGVMVFLNSGPDICHAASGYCF